MKKILFLLNFLFVTSLYGTQYFVSVSGAKIDIWDITKEDGQEHVITLEGHKTSVEKVVFDPADENILASISSDRTVRIWKTESGNWLDAICIQALCANKGRGRSLVFSNDGKHLAFDVGNNTIRIVETKLWKQIKEINKLPNWVSPGIAFHPYDSNIIVFVSASSEKNEVHIMNIQSRQVLKILKADFNKLKSVHISADGNYIASRAFNNMICIWDAKGGELVGEIGKPSWDIVTTMFGFHLCSDFIIYNYSTTKSYRAEDELRIVNWKKNWGRNYETKIGGFGYRGERSDEKDIRSASYNPRFFTHFAIGYGSGFIKIWEVKRESKKFIVKKNKVLKKRAGDVRALAFGSNL